VAAVQGGIKGIPWQAKGVESLSGTGSVLAWVGGQGTAVHKPECQPAFVSRHLIFLACGLVQIMGCSQACMRSDPSRTHICPCPVVTSMLPSASHHHPGQL